MENEVKWHGASMNEDLLNSTLKELDELEAAL